MAGVVEGVWGGRKVKDSVELILLQGDNSSEALKEFLELLSVLLGQALLKNLW